MKFQRFLAENEGYVTPSDQFTATVHITNNTDGALAYQKGSMNLGADTTPIPGRPMTDFTGYNGAKIPLTHVASMDTGHLAMRQLFDKRIGRRDWNLVLSVYDLLAEKGYTGDSRISDYLLDFYKNKYGEPELTWQSLEQNHWDDVINDFAPEAEQMFTSILHRKNTPGHKILLSALMCTLWGSIQTAIIRFSLNGRRRRRPPFPTMLFTRTCLRLHLQMKSQVSTRVCAQGA